MLRAQAHNIALLQNTLKPHRQCPALLLSPPAACHIGGCPQPRSTADRLTYTSPPPCTELHQEGLISTCILLYCSLWDAVLCNAWVPGSSNAVPAACATKMHLCSCSCILTGISELRYCSPLGIRCFAVVNGHTSLGRSSDQRSSCHRQLTLARPTSGPHCSNLLVRWSSGGRVQAPGWGRLPQPSPALVGVARDPLPPRAVLER